MQRYIAFAIKEISKHTVFASRLSINHNFPAALFYMHRGFFAQAMEDNPSDPMGSRYAQSVLAAYSSACSFVGLIESLFKQHPILTERMWFLFTHVFSCAVSHAKYSKCTRVNLPIDCAWVYRRQITNGISAICTISSRIRLQSVCQGH